VAVREYLDKNIKWHFGKIIEKLGKLHYRIKLNDGKVWKRHVNQMRAVGLALTENINSDIRLRRSEYKC